MPDAWYCRFDGCTSGPFTRDELVFLAARGRLGRNDSVREGDAGQWVPAQTLEGLFASTDAPAAPRDRTRPHASPASKPPSHAVPPPLPDHPPALPGHHPRRDGPVENEASRRRRLLIGTGIAAAVALLVVLLLWWLWPRDQPVLAGTGNSAESRGSGTGAAVGAGSASSTFSTEENQTAGTAAQAAVDRGEQAGESDSVAAEGRGPADIPLEETTETARPQPAPESAVVETAPVPPEPQTFSIQRLEVQPPAPARGQPSPTGRTARMFAGRTAKNRDEILREQGGTAESEAAVGRGLDWLARHQHAHGHWGLHSFPQAGRCNGRCGHTGVDSDAAATGLALMAFLGAGQTHQGGDYREVVRRGIDWLVRDQHSSGTFQSIGAGNMYAHGQASIALCEALAMTGDRALREPARKAVQFIVQAQDPRGGGWRYQPQMAGDTSVLGWQIMALRSAETAELDVPRPTIARAVAYLNTAQTDSYGGQYGYLPGQGSSPAMTAEALLCRQYTGWPKRQMGLRVGVEYLMNHLPTDRNFNMYYIYYATQTLHHMGGNEWNRWNDTVRELLIRLQETQGHAAGSWTPRGGRDLAGGRVYMTALAVCTLEVYYRHSKLYAD